MTIKEFLNPTIVKPVKGIRTLEIIESLLRFGLKIGIGIWIFKIIPIIAYEIFVGIGGYGL